MVSCAIEINDWPDLSIQHFQLPRFLSRILFQAFPGPYSEPHNLIIYRQTASSSTKHGHLSTSVYVLAFVLSGWFNQKTSPLWALYYQQKTKSTSSLKGLLFTLGSYNRFFRRRKSGRWQCQSFARCVESVVSQNLTNLSKPIFFKVNKIAACCWVWQTFWITPADDSSCSRDPDWSKKNFAGPFFRSINLDPPKTLSLSLSFHQVSTNGGTPPTTFVKVPFFY